MDSYKFTYRRIRGACAGCEARKRQSLLKRLFTKDKHKCDLQWMSYEVIGHGPENYSKKETQVLNGQVSDATLSGHNLDKMVLYFPNGALRTVADWHNCELKLDTDWVLFTKKKMERESGHDVKLSVNPDRVADM